MKENNYDELYIQLEMELGSVEHSEVLSVQEIKNSLTYIRNALHSLKENIKKHPFETEAEKIEFFKMVKPKFYSWQIYYLELYSIAIELPVGSNKEKIKYYQDKLKYLDRFFHKNQFNYLYFKWNAEDLDFTYFLRNVATESVLLPELPDVDRSFSTSMDYLFSKFIAYERLQVYLVNIIKHISMPISMRQEERQPTAALKWTGDAINLVEVAYGIWLSGQINHGNAGISEIIRWLEDNLHINIGRAYRRWTEISSRKRISTTKYIDQMKESINRRMEEEYSLKKGRRHTP